MSCHHPLKAFWTGTFTDTGKLSLYLAPDSPGDVVSAAFVESKGYHIGAGAPLVSLNGQPYLKDPLLIPCGKCVGCRMTNAKQWTVRLVHEAEDYKDRCWFLTLTYRDECLPFTQDGELTLVKSAISGFMKRLRTYSGKQYRFFGCGEYGTDENATHRPHYHVILFGDLDDLIPFKFNRFHSSLVEKSWPFGLHEVSPADPGCMAYVAGYVEKKQKDPYWDDYPVKPFHIMSRMPAIGYKYVPRVNGESDNHVYGNFGNSHYASVPRAYLKKLVDKPWFEEYKKRCLTSAKKSRLLDQAVYQSTDETIIGFLKDDASYEALEKVRNETL